ncbi:MAG: alpha/beta hydrolase domain-containing protein [Pseudomonadota bacterium]
MRLSVAAMAGACITHLCVSGAEAKITQLKIDRVEPFAAGMAFGDAGSYERVAGTAKGELDPRDPRNAVIVNLDRAPRNPGGMVEYEVDFYLLRPADAAKGNRKILFDVTNRGRKFLLHWLMDAPAQAGAAVNEPAEAKDAGNGLFFRHGYLMAWTGWDPDAPRANNGMAIKVPVAMLGASPVVRTIRDELVSGTRGAPADVFRLSYEAANLDPAQARLTVRRKEAYGPSEIPAGGWAYVNPRAIRLLPEGTQPEPGSLYDMRYPAKNPHVLGIGYAATRDLVSFLRYESRDAAGISNPAGPGIKSALAVGISQSGRYLRDHVSQGFNQDESKRKVFDGVLAHISGVGRVFMNAEFGQPARTNTQHEDHFYPENEFPFSAARFHDKVTGKTGALLRGDGFDPLLIEVNTSTEYWQKGASLLHTDPTGRHDAALPQTARVYLIAGTQHGGRVGLTSAAGPCANPRNPHNPAPALRALLIALDQWANEAKAPPPSRVPTIAAGTLVAPDRTGFPAIPGTQVAREVNQIMLFGDWVDPKPDPKKAYRALVSKVDADGNEIAGIRLPDIGVPLATYTGWNLYKAPFPDGELCDRDGSHLPFARTRAERTAKGDPRPAIAERYADHADYVTKVGAAAAELVKARLLLQEDADRYLEAAKARNPLQP